MDPWLRKEFREEREKGREFGRVESGGKIDQGRKQGAVVVKGRSKR